MDTLNKFHQISYAMLSNRYTLSIVGLKITRYLLINELFTIKREWMFYDFHLF